MIHIHTHIYHIHLFLYMYLYLYKCKKLWITCGLCLCTQPTKELSSAIIFERTRLFNFFQLHQDQHKCLGSQEGQFKSKIASQPGELWVSASCFLPRLSNWLLLDLSLVTKTKVTLSSEARKEGTFICNKTLEPDGFILQNPLNPWTKLAIASTTTTALSIGGRMRRNLATLRQNEIACNFRRLYYYILYVSPLQTVTDPCNFSLKSVIKWQA